MVGKKFIVLSLILAAISALAFGKDLNARKIQLSPTTYIVNLEKEGFYPKDLRIRAGETVKFTTTNGKYFWPASNLHPTHLIYPEFDPKQPVKPEDSWSFTFKKKGAWKYHDHLAANFEGSVTVYENPLDKGSAKVSENCKEVSKNLKQQCWDNLMEQTLARKGLDEAFLVFEKLYETEPEVPKSCHGWGHTLGEAAFKLYLGNEKFKLSPKTSYCGYGFYHGFMESLLLSGMEVKRAKNFCEYAKRELEGKANGVYENCLHGIGHGSVEVDDPKIWGNFQAMLTPGLRICESILSSPKELELCYTGAFNAMELNAFYGDYKLKFNKKDPFYLCKNQPKKYQSPCYFEFAGTLSYSTNHNFKKAVAFILEIPDPLIAQTAVRKTAADFLQIDIVNDDFIENILNCQKLPDLLRLPCINGTEIGFLAHGNPETGFRKAIEFCSNQLLKADEKKLCFESLAGNIKFSYSLQKYEEACKAYKGLSPYCKL